MVDPAADVGKLEKDRFVIFCPDSCLATSWMLITPEINLQPAEFHRPKINTVDIFARYYIHYVTADVCQTRLTLKGKNNK